MNKPFDFSAPRVLTADDAVTGFNCGVEVLNHYLSRYALQAQKGDGARTYLTKSSDGAVAGYYTLAYAAVEYETAPIRSRKGLARHPIPVMLLARLAVDVQFTGKGLGREMLRDAMLRTLNAADIAGLRAIVVEAKDDTALSFYRRYGFEPFCDETKRLALILKDVRALLSSKS